MHAQYTDNGPLPPSHLLGTREAIRNPAERGERGNRQVRDAIIRAPPSNTQGLSISPVLSSLLLYLMLVLMFYNVMVSSEQCSVWCSGQCSVFFVLHPYNRLLGIRSSGCCCCITELTASSYWLSLSHPTACSQWGAASTQMAPPPAVCSCLVLCQCALFPLYTDGCFTRQHSLLPNRRSALLRDHCSGLSHRGITALYK